MGLAPSRVCEDTAKTEVSRCLSQFFNMLINKTLFSTHSREEHNRGNRNR
jgi:hypothetical protein